MVKAGQRDGKDANHLHLYCIHTNLPQQVKQIVWCEIRNQFTQQVTPHQTEADTPINENQGPSINCLDTGATVLPSSWHKMKKAGLKAASIYKNLTSTLGNLGRAPLHWPSPAVHNPIAAEEANSEEGEKEVVNTTKKSGGTSAGAHQVPHHQVSIPKNTGTFKKSRPSTLHQVPPHQVPSRPASNHGRTNIISKWLD